MDATEGQRKPTIGDLHAGRPPTLAAGDADSVVLK